MLKALIQLFSESFLKSKSDWVGGQVLPKSRISLDTSIKTYTAPSDGWIVFWGLPADVLEANVTSGGSVLLSSSVPKYESQGFAVSVYLRSLRDRKSTCWETKPQTFCNVGLLQPLALRNLLSTGGKLC